MLLSRDSVSTKIGRLHFPKAEKERETRLKDNFQSSSAAKSKNHHNFDEMKYISSYSQDKEHLSSSEKVERWQDFQFLKDHDHCPTYPSSRVLCT